MHIFLKKLKISLYNIAYPLKLIFDLQNDLFKCFFLEKKNNHALK